MPTPEASLLTAAGQVFVRRADEKDGVFEGREYHYIYLLSWGMIVPPKLRIDFQTEEAFAQEYARNISNGGLFIATREVVELRKTLTVELSLVPLGTAVSLQAEVVHCVPEVLAKTTGSEPGVAVQFALGRDPLRKELESLIPSGALSLVLSVDERQGHVGRRSAARTRAHVLARLRVDGEWIDGRTRNISGSGVLMTIARDPLPIGVEVALCIAHPTSGEEMELRGVVMRHVVGAGETCMGIEFQISAQRTDEVARFVDCVRAAEHNRRLGGINGPISALGVATTLRMFGSMSPHGMLTVTRGAEEGYVVFDDGSLRAQLGPLEGREALTAILAWRDGSFDFEGHGDDELVGGPAIPLAEVIVPDAPAATAGPGVSAPPSNGRQIAPPDGNAVLVVNLLTLDTLAGDLSKTEEAILDLAGVGMTVAKIVEVIPESELEIRRAIVGLIDQELISTSA